MGGILTAEEGQQLTQQAAQMQLERLSDKYN
ncbi:hypothetical protein VTN00DRAFT_7467 [Thermoascus crustaceus]